jgi:serine/threonine protein kinase
MKIVPRYELKDLKPGRRVGIFKVLELYPEGRGGMSRVVKAGPADGRGSEAALKISRTGRNLEYFYAAIQKEVEIIQQLDHPGVVRLIAVSQGKNPFKERAVEIVDSPWFFGMECLQGGTLESYMRGLGPLTLEEAAAIAHQLGRTLNYIHHRGFSHNDIKPDNVLFRKQLEIGERLEPVLIDFGVAARLVRHQPDGSVVYMAPERLGETKDPSPPEVVAEQDLSKADVWSLGVLFYRMLAGREPFLGVTDRSITSAIQRGIPDSISSTRNDIPRAVDDFVLDGCLAKDPGLRVTMAQFDHFIDQYSGDWRAKRLPKEKRRPFWRRAFSG